MSGQQIKKLKSKTQIDRVFKKGRTVKSGVLAMHYIEKGCEQNYVHIGVGVPKRFVLLACRRNRIKRQIRAVIQQQQKEVFEVLRPGYYMILYKGRVVADTDDLFTSLRGLMGNLSS